MERFFFFLFLAGCLLPNCKSQETHIIEEVSFAYQKDRFQDLSFYVTTLTNVSLSLDNQTFIDYTIFYQPMVGIKMGAGIQNGIVDMILAQSTTGVFAITRDTDMELVMVTEETRDSFGLITKGSILSPRDLKNKTIGVEMFSLAHFQLFKLLEMLGLDEVDDVIIKYDSVDVITNKWIEGGLDCVFVWNPYLQTLLEKGGNLMISSGQIADWGKRSFIGFWVSKDFVKRRPENVQLIVRMLDLIDKGVSEWNSIKDYPNLLENPQNIIGTIANLTNVNRTLLSIDLKENNYVGVKEQLECYQKGIGCSTVDNINAMNYTAQWYTDIRRFTNGLPSYADFINYTYAQILIEQRTKRIL